MRLAFVFRWCFLLVVLSLAFPCPAQNSKPADSSGTSSSRSKKTPKAPARESGLDEGGVVGGFYRNKSLALSVKIPPGWVFRTEEMNARDEPDSPADNSKSSPQGTQRATGEVGGRVLLAAFSRPPEAKGADVNASIVIAAEPVSAYPGFTEDEDPYEIAIGPKTVVRTDFHKDVGSRVMRQSTLIFLARGYAVSITVIGGTDDEVEDLLDGVEFSGK